MSFRLGLVLCALGLALSSCGSDTPTATPVAYEDPIYRAGQEWAFAPGTDDAGATVIVLRTERLGDVVVIHVAVHGLHMHAPTTPTIATTEIGHLPFDRAALDASHLTLVRQSVPLPPYEAGYDEWRSAHGGVWTVPVPDVIAAVERGLAGH